MMYIVNFIIIQQQDTLCLSICVINYYEFCLLWKNALKSKTRNFTDDDKYMNYVTGVWLMQSTSTSTCTSISLPNSYNLDYHSNGTIQK